MLSGKSVPGILDVAAIKDQKQEGDDNTSASEDEEDLLPAPEALTTQDEQHGEANIDEQTDKQHPPLRGNAKYGERCQQIIAQVNPAALTGGCPDGRERNGYGKGESKPGIKAYPEKDEPHTLAPTQQPAQKWMQDTADEHIIATGTGHRGRKGGVHPQQCKCHQQRTDDDRHQHIAIGKICRCL